MHPPGRLLGRGPGEAGRAARGSLAPHRGVPGRDQEPCVCFLQVGDLVQGWDCARSLSSSPPFWFSSGAPLAPPCSLPPPFPQSGEFSSSTLCPQVLPPTPQLQVAHCSASNPSSFRARLLHPPSWTWVGGITKRGPLEATCLGHPRALNSRIPRSRGDPRAH